MNLSGFVAPFYDTNSTVASLTLLVLSRNLEPVGEQTVPIGAQAERILQQASAEIPLGELASMSLASLRERFPPSICSEIETLLERLARINGLSDPEAQEEADAHFRYRVEHYMSKAKINGGALKKAKEVRDVIKNAAALLASSACYEAVAAECLRLALETVEQVVSYIEAVIGVMPEPWTAESYKEYRREMFTRAIVKEQERLAKIERNFTLAIPVAAYIATALGPYQS